ncbi:MAG TPA: arginine--tRNA ligase [bacterium]|nr:arginine--tRNA ligase [bacterium]
MRIRHELDARISAAFTALLGRDAPALVRNADPRFGDYQANGVMGQAKRDKTNPRELAAKLIAALDIADLCAPPEIAGPGFINLKLSDDFLAHRLAAMAADQERLDVDKVEAPQTIIVDLSSPNVAKPLHVGHLRSTILGDAIVRILRFLGHRVIADNHVGDWGTQFGMLIVGFRRWGDEDKLAHNPTDELERVYRLANDAGKQDAAVAEEARAELVKLQAGDADNLALWKRFIAATRAELDVIYDRLDVHFDEWRGESAYHDALAPLVEKLLADGVAVIDDGATVMFFSAEDNPELVDKPFLIRKSDGAFLYATTDLATLQYRLAAHDADEIVYVVDKRQALHFKQLFAAAHKLGWRVRLAHVDFGAILGPDGRPIKTREGGSVRLADLLSEAAARAATIIEEKNPELAADERARVAEAVGIGAVKYADLSQNRSSDYRFDWDKLLAFDGNTAPYLQYVHARIRSIFRKLGDEQWRPAAGFTPELTHASERALTCALLRFADVAHDLPQDYLLHQLSDHLFALAQAFNAFYRDCPVLSSTGATLDTRLTLCLVTARQIALGLNLLGIAAPERM